MLNRAIGIIEDEHNSLKAVLHGLNWLVRHARETTAEPDFRLLWALLNYIDAFPEKLHHPKEDAYLFRRLRERTREADAVLDTLARQHREQTEQVREMELALGHWEGGAADGLERFARAVERYTADAWEHVRIEEQEMLPLAREHLAPEDWEQIATAFGENGDPRFSAEHEHEFREMFTRIVNMAPPPIGVGPERD